MTAADPITRTLTATTQGRYVLRAPDALGPHPLLVGFHGYGENAEVHLRQLERIPGASKWLIVAVQALHWFYDPAHRTVVASWMTKLGRDRAIADNLRYVGEAIADVRERFAAGETLVYAGFSQGASMAYRAAAGAGHPSHGLIVLGGDVPPGTARRSGTRLPADAGRPRGAGRVVHPGEARHGRGAAGLARRCRGPRSSSTARTSGPTRSALPPASSWRTSPGARPPGHRAPAGSGGS